MMELQVLVIKKKPKYQFVHVNKNQYVDLILEFWRALLALFPERLTHTHKKAHTGLFGKFRQVEIYPI